MVNPASIMKIMNLKNKFAANHPKFVSFITASMVEFRREQL